VQVIRDGPFSMKARHFFSIVIAFRRGRPATRVNPENERLRGAAPEAKTAKVSLGFVLLHQLGGLGLPIGPVGCHHPGPLDCFPELVSVVSGRRDPAIASRSYSSSRARRLRRHAQLSGEEDGPCRHGDHALHGRRVPPRDAARDLRGPASPDPSAGGEHCR
jgi:hypothetical protein